MLLSIGLLARTQSNTQPDYWLVRTDYYGIEQGLSHRDVECIQQDKQGFMWFGTNYGLNRFDGYNFKWFTKEKHGLLSNMINHMITDGDGLLWLCNTGNRLDKTTMSIDIFNPVTEEVISFEKKFGKSAPCKVKDIVDFISSREGTILLLTAQQKIIIYTPQKGFVVSDLQIQPIRLACFSNHNTFYAYNSSNNNFSRNSIVEIDFTGNVLHRFEHKNVSEYLFIAGNDHTDKLHYIAKKALSLESDQFVKGTIYTINGSGVEEKLFEKNTKLKYELINLDIPAYSGDNNFWMNHNEYDFCLHGRNSFQIFNPEKGWYFELSKDNKWLAMPNTVFFDNKNRTWVGTEFGVYLIEVYANHFQKILHNSPVMQTTIRGMVEDNDENLWIGSDRGNSFSWIYLKGETEADDFKTGWKKLSNNFTAPPPIINYTYGFFKDKSGRIWIGHGETDMIFRIGTKDESFNTTSYALPDLSTNFWTFFEDDDSKIWFSTDISKIGYVSQQTNQVILLDELTGVREAGGCIYQFLKDKNGKVWLATDNGLFHLNIKTNQIEPYGPDPGKQEFIIPWQGVFYIHEDKDGAFWLATRGTGLFRWIPGTTNYQQFTKADGLSDNTLYAVYEDDFDNLWMSSDYGIIRFNKTTHHATAYLEKDGISHNEFNRIAHYKNKNGRIYFGGLNGITTFDPKNFVSDTTISEPQLVVTEFHQFDGEEGKLVDRLAPLRLDNTISLEPDDRFFLLEFALLTFNQIQKVQYAYKVEGVDADWTYQNENSIRFSRLPYGKHLLRIKAQPANGRWSKNELKISIVVFKPFYLQTWFIVSLILAVISGFYIYSQLRYKSLIKRQIELEKVVEERTRTISEDKHIIEQQAEELQSLEKLKSRFFANVSHELRTPLTLLLGPIDSLLKRIQNNETDKKLLQFVQRNAMQLQKLINEILDLSKLEVNKMNVVEEPVNFFPYLKEQLAQFHSFSSSDRLHFEIQYKIERSLQLLLDKSKFEKIVHNFLSNAMKFTPPDGTVTLTIKEHGDDIQLSVADTGKGIHPDDLPHIFDRFYQSNQPDVKTEGGTGIGLSLCKELAILLGGDVWAESKLGTGSIFYFRFPKKEADDTQSAVESIQQETTADINENQFTTDNYDSKESITKSSEEKKYKVIEESGRPAILVVEDNPDLREYMQFLLSQYYNVSTAENGQAAIDCLNETANQKDQPAGFHLIISDLMMPFMDGFQLLEKLKSDDRWRHIPVIMLTAKVNMQAKLQALRIGVDDYLTKPFIEEELKARIENLLRNYKERMEHFVTAGISDGVVHTAEEPIIAQVDMEWLKQVETTFSKVLSDRQFNMEWIASELNLSQRQFSRRLQKLTGLTPNYYLQEMRLQMAKDLLLSGKYATIKETGFAVGFLDTPYFSSLFQQRFGVTPSNYQR